MLSAVKLPTLLCENEVVVLKKDGLFTSPDIEETKSLAPGVVTYTRYVVKLPFTETSSNCKPNPS